LVNHLASIANLVTIFQSHHKTQLLST
jgi:hypothetical protein